MKRGLVLEGGGAKGAYAFGCLAAIKESGLEIHAVAGTSVGALNAALWSTNQLDFGAELWRNLNQDKVYPFRLPRVVAQVLAPFVIFPGLYIGYVDGRSKHGERLFRPLTPLLFVVVWCVLVCEVACDMIVDPPNQHSFDASTMSFSHWCAVVFVLVMIVAVTLSAWNSLAMRWHLLGWMVCIAPFGLIFFRSVWWKTPAPLPLGMYLTVLLPAVIVATETVLKRFNLSVLLSGPLNKHIATVLSHPLLIPTYVTTAEECTILDPDNVEYYNFGDRDAPDRRPVFANRYVPNYHLLNNLPPTEQANALLASAALPFGIVPVVKVCGTDSVDGGVADNTPLYPLVEFERCDEVIVVRLNPHVDTGDLATDFFREKWAKINRDLELKAAPIPKDLEALLKAFPNSRENNPPKIVPYKVPSNWPRRVVVIAPKESLGGFLDGTLNFTQKFSRGLIDKGYQDAKDAIARHYVNGVKPTVGT